MLDKNKFVVKGQTKLLSSTKNYELVDGDSTQPVGSATDVTGFFAGLFGKVDIEIRSKANNALVCSVRRHGFPMKKVQVLDPQGEVVGTYKPKMLSLTGGYHIYDRDGKHFCEIKGNLFKAAYKFLTPDGKTELGSVSKTWGGLAKELFTSADTYGVQIAPGAASDQKAKMLILGAAIAIDAIFKQKSKGGDSGDKESGGGEEDE